jgi:predicted site-specific integrase-resolvase
MKLDDQTIYTAAEAAAKLGISPTTLKRQRQNGRIPGILIGRDYVYSAEAIRRYRLDVQRPAGRRSHAGSRFTHEATTLTK